MSLITQWGRYVVAEQYKGYTDVEILKRPQGAIKLILQGQAGVR